MKRMSPGLSIIGVAALLLSLTPGVGFTQDAGRAPHRSLGDRILFRGINFSPDQWKGYEDLLVVVHANIGMWPANSATAAEKAALQRAHVYHDTAAANEIMRSRDAKADALQVHIFSAIRDLLTPPQQRVFDANVSRFMAWQAQSRDADELNRNARTLAGKMPTP